MSSGKKVKEEVGEGIGGGRGWRSGEGRSLNENLEDAKTVEKDPTVRALRYREAPKDREAQQRASQTGGKGKRLPPQKRKQND